MKKDNLEPRAVWAGEIFKEPNPIIQESIRQFVVELFAKVEKEERKDRRDYGLAFLEEAVEGDYFLWLQMLMFIAKHSGVKFPQLEDLQ